LPRPLAGRTTHFTVFLATAGDDHPRIAVVHSVALATEVEGDNRDD
jgi:hypothetical protein